MGRIVDADAHSLTLRLAGTFTPTNELNRDAAKATGAIRSDIEVGDIGLLLERLADVRVADEVRQLRHRYLALLRDSLHTPSGSPLRGLPPAGRR